MDTFLPILNSLQELCSSVDSDESVIKIVDLPQIAVVGSQSAGKTSILESFLGQPCLPRGYGMVTRCPLILQLRKLAAEESHSWYCVFGHSPEIEHRESSTVQEEILRRQAVLVISGVSWTPIILKFYCTTAINLTLVDLPGLIRLPMGDQAGDLDEQIRGLILDYIRKPACVILAVSAANVDLANSDALRIAREVDPDGIRTVGVLTKCDLIEEEQQTNIIDVLRGRIHPLKRGYVAVRCRGPKEEKISNDLLETNFFKEHLAFGSLAETHCGSKRLASKISNLLLEHIQMHLPQLKLTVDNLHQDTDTQIKNLGLPIDDKAPVLLNLLSRYTRVLDDFLEGRINDLGNSNELFGGARLHFLFQDWFANYMMKADPLCNLCDNEIRTSIRNASGSSSSLFVPEAAFESLVRKQIVLLLQPTLECVNQVR